MKTKIKKIILFFLLAFLLNLLWEVSHSPLYNWNSLPLQNSVYFYVPTILLNSLGDLMYISIIFLIISAINKKFSWISSPKKKHYLFLAIFSLILSILIEIKGIFILNKWSYSSFMPLVFGIGISPLLELAVTSCFSLWLCNYFIPAKQKHI